MRPFVLGGSGDASGLCAACCSVVFCCFAVLPSVMLSSSVLGVGPTGALAGVIGGAHDVGAVVRCAGVSSVMTSFCVFDDASSSSSSSSSSSYSSSYPSSSSMGC